MYVDLCRALVIHFTSDRSVCASYWRERLNAERVTLTRMDGVCRFIVLMACGSGPFAACTTDVTQTGCVCAVHVESDRLFVVTKRLRGSARGSLFSKVDLLRRMPAACVEHCISLVADSVRPAAECADETGGAVGRRKQRLQARRKQVTTRTKNGQARSPTIISASYRKQPCSAATRQ